MPGETTFAVMPSGPSYVAAQVFSTAADLGYGYEISYVAEQEDVATAQGLPVRASPQWPELNADDLVLVPGWRAPTLRERPWISDPVLRRLFDHHQAGATATPSRPARCCGTAPTSATPCTGSKT